MVNEALSYGCPVLVSERCGCVPELVGPGSGLTFDPLDTEALFRGMATLADAPPSAETCLATIVPFTPEAAASSMFAALFPGQQDAENLHPPYPPLEGEVARGDSRVTEG